MKISIEQKSIPTVPFKTLVAGDLFVFYEDSESIHIKTDEGSGVSLRDGCTAYYEPDDLVTDVTDQFELTRTAEYLE
jgi:hypothetical protein